MKIFISHNSFDKVKSALRVLIIPNSFIRELDKIRPMPRTIEVFISYAHENEKYLTELRKNIINLERNDSIKVWTDDAILAGERWDDAIKANLERSELVLFLVSPDFIASDYIHRVEIENAMDRHRQGNTRIVPIIIRPCDFRSLPISKFQALPKGARPISKWNDKDEAWLDVTVQLRKLVEHLQETPPPHTQDKDKDYPPVNNIQPNSAGYNFAQLKQDIAQGKLKQTIATILDISSNIDSDIYNNLILLASRFNSNERSINLGLISVQDASMNRNRITHAILHMIEELESK